MFESDPFRIKPLGPSLTRDHANLAMARAPAGRLTAVDAPSAPPKRTTGRTSDTLPPSQCADGDARLPPSCAAETSGRSAWSRGAREPQKEVGSAVHASHGAPERGRRDVPLSVVVLAVPGSRLRAAGPTASLCGRDELSGLSGPKGPKHHLCPASAHGPRGRRPSPPAPARWNTLRTPDSHAAARLRRALEAWCSVRRHGH